MLEPIEMLNDRPISDRCAFSLLLDPVVEALYTPLFMDPTPYRFLILYAVCSSPNAVCSAKDD